MGLSIFFCDSIIYPTKNFSVISLITLNLTQFFLINHKRLIVTIMCTSNDLLNFIQTKWDNVILNFDEISYNQLIYIIHSIAQDRL